MTLCINMALFHFRHLQYGKVGVESLYRFQFSFQNETTTILACMCCHCAILTPGFILSCRFEKKLGKLCNKFWNRNLSNTMQLSLYSHPPTITSSHHHSHHHTFHHHTLPPSHLPTITSLTISPGHLSTRCGFMPSCLAATAVALAWLD